MVFVEVPERHVLPRSRSWSIYSVPQHTEQTTSSGRDRGEGIATALLLPASVSWRAAGGSFASSSLTSECAVDLLDCGHGRTQVDKGRHHVSFSMVTTQDRVLPA